MVLNNSMILSLDYKFMENNRKLSIFNMKHNHSSIISLINYKYDHMNYNLSLDLCICRHMYVITCMNEQVYMGIHVYVKVRSWHHLSNSVSHSPYFWDSVSLNLVPIGWQDLLATKLHQPCLCHTSTGIASTTMLSFLLCWN